MWRKAIVPFALALTAATVLVAAQPAASATQLLAAGDASDFNGDGRADIAIGEPERDFDGGQIAGAVHVAYGSTTGLKTTGSQFFRQGASGVPGELVNFARFGQAVASGNFDGDGYADLAISAPGNQAATLTVLYGSADGIQTDDARAFTYAEAGPGSSDSIVKLAAGDFDGDGRDDLAIGYARASAGASNDGVVRVLYGSLAGLDTARTKLFSQDTAGVTGTSEDNDYFGGDLAAGDFNGDGRDDLAISAYQEDVGDIVDAGSVTVLRGSSTGLTATGSKAFSQSTSGVAGTNETADLFGYSLAAGDITRDGRDDLVVGSRESVGSITSAGTVTTLLGSASGLTGTGSQAFTQNTSGIPDSAEASDDFGDAVALGDFNGDGYADLAVGNPGESLSAGPAAGAVTVIRGSRTGLTATGAKQWAQSTADVLDTAEARDVCGFTVRATPVRGAAQADLIFGCALEDTSGEVDNGAIAMLRGSSSGLTATSDQFLSGASLAGGAQSHATFGASLG